MYTSMFRKAMLGDTALLSLDFSAGTVPTAVTFTRADSTARATYIDASGYVKTVASAGAARFDYTGGVAKGLLIEASATNYMFGSKLINGFSNSNMETVTAGSETDPEGIASAARQIYASNTTGYHGFSRSTTAGTNTQITVSVWAKARTYTYLFLSDLANGRSAVLFNLSTGAVGSTYGAGFVSAKTTAFANNWYRCEMVVNISASTSYNWSLVGCQASATFNSYGAQYTGTGNAADGIYCYGFQVEAGSTASSYIPSDGTILTRLADDAVIRSTAWTSLYAQPGAMVVEFYRGAYGDGDRSIMCTDPTATRHWHLKQANASATAQIAFSAGSPVTQTGLVSGLNKVAIAWNAPTPTASFDLCVNGATPTFGGSNVGTTLSTWLTLGSQSTTGVSGTGTWDGYLNNSIKSVKYYSALTYAEMIAKTT